MRDIESPPPPNVPYSHVHFLVRPRKRTKKNGTVRHGAGGETRFHATSCLKWSSHDLPIPSYYVFSWLHYPCWISVPGRHTHFLSLYLLFFLRPFSCTPKKKDQKERRRSARGRFFHETPLRSRPTSVPYEPLRNSSAMVLDGSARKNPQLRHRTLDRRDPRLGAVQFLDRRSAVVKCKIRRDLPPIPLLEGRRNGDASMYWPSESTEIAFSYQSQRT